MLRNDGSTWTRPFPVISDLRAIWDMDFKDQSQGTKQRTAEALLNKTYPDLVDPDLVDPDLVDPDLVDFEKKFHF